MPEAAWAAAVIRGVAEYGILGIGWILFFITGFYVRLERRRYQDLVIHIIQYFTKIHMAEGREDVIPFSLTDFSRSQENQRRRGASRSPADSESDAG